MWGGFLRLALALLPFLKILSQWLQKRRERAEVKEAAEAAINKAEVEAARVTSEILSERRSDDAAASRMRNGSF